MIADYGNFNTMIANYDSPDRKLDPARELPNHADSLGSSPCSNPALDSLTRSIKSWIASHPTQAVLATTATGILLGWLVKRRDS